MRPQHTRPDGGAWSAPGTADLVFAVARDELVEIDRTVAVRIQQLEERVHLIALHAELPQPNCDLRFGRIVVSEKEVPNMLAILV